MKPVYVVRVVERESAVLRLARPLLYAVWVIVENWPQCRAKYLTRYRSNSYYSTYRCTRGRWHVGKHEDIRGGWET